MTIFIAGASGATGRLLVEQLLASDQNVKIVVRSFDTLSAGIINHPNLSVINASILDLGDVDMARNALLACCDRCCRRLWITKMRQTIYEPASARTIQ
jgi:nucleoside-diphosphate-sugar epimerase|tara:strand:- start:48 stop:341 length:294 start_codon:yes stop_codon:yes gene_type:complete